MDLLIMRKNIYLFVSAFLKQKDCLPNENADRVLLSSRHVRHETLCHPLILHEKRIRCSGISSH